MRSLLHVSLAPRWFWHLSSENMSLTRILDHACYSGEANNFIAKCFVITNTNKINAYVNGLHSFPVASSQFFILLSLQSFAVQPWVKCHLNHRKIKARDDVFIRTSIKGSSQKRLSHCRENAIFNNNQLSMQHQLFIYAAPIIYCTCKGNQLLLPSLGTNKPLIPSYTKVTNNRPQVESFAKSIFTKKLLTKRSLFTIGYSKTNHFKNLRHTLLKTFKFHLFTQQHQTTVVLRILEK